MVGSRDSPKLTKFLSNKHVQLLGVSNDTQGASSRLVCPNVCVCVCVCLCVCVERERESERVREGGRERGRTRERERDGRA